MGKSLTQNIKTVAEKYPQIYAYTLPTMHDKVGWIKVGETTRKDVRDRILEQVKTAAFDHSKEYELKWAHPAFLQDGTPFSDKELHSFYRKHQIKQGQNSDGRLSEWFYFNDNPNRALHLYRNFVAGDYRQIQDGEVAPYQLRQEQAAAVAQTLAAQKAGYTEFLWNAKPRFGKTLTTYDLMKKMDAVNVLVVTNRPAIANSWFDDFQQFIGKPYFFVSESDSLKGRDPLSRIDYMKAIGQHDMNSEEVQKYGESRQLNFVSLQDLKGSRYFGGPYDKLKDVADTQWDLLVIDEAHEGVDTFKTDVAFDQIKRKFTLHLSGTPFKALAKGRFAPDQIYNWSYADEQAAKQNWYATHAAKQEWDVLEENNPYEQLPQLSMFTYKLSDMIAAQVNRGATLDGDHNVEYMFDLNEFFATNDGGRFVHESDVKKFLDTLTSNEKYPFSTNELRRELKHTFWLLNRVDSAKALKCLLEEHPVFGGDNYKILLAVGQDSDTADLKAVRNAIRRNTKTITLSVGQLTTGVTIPEWTAVLMLSNLKSPSLYMQAAFRAQNPWTYQDEQGNTYTKERAYVFDFAPERTLIVFDEFANNLGQQGTDRAENIRTLLNFFPVIGEDNEGTMVPLDAQQVLTIPRAIKAKEVVKSGFMSNFLFDNVVGIFQSTQAKDILDLLPPERSGWTTPSETTIHVSDYVQDKLDDDGNVALSRDFLQNKKESLFGTGVYHVETLDKLETVLPEKHTESFARSLAKEVVRDIDLRPIQATYDVTKTALDRIEKRFEQAVQDVVNREAKEYEIVKAHIEKDIQQATEELTTQDDVADKVAAQALIDAERARRLAEAQAQYRESVTQKVQTAVETQMETVVQQQEVKKVVAAKKETEDDVRARLRGFARTIPSFLMAYGQPTTTLSNFDTTIDDTVFKEVTGITLAQFRALRDEYHFFSQTVFDESIQEFLRTKERLANYFDVTQEEDIFDYIPPQKTNQIFTPRSVVTMMVDALEQENPTIFQDKDKTFADLYMKSGLYLTEIVKRLYVGLAEQIPNNEERLRHILEHQIYGFAPTEIIYRIARNFIFGFDERAQRISGAHIVCLDTTPYARGEAAQSFEDKCDELFGTSTN